MIHTDQNISELTSKEVIEPIPSTSGTSKQTTQEITNICWQKRRKCSLCFISRMFHSPAAEKNSDVDKNLEKGKGKKQQSEILTSTPIKKRNKKDSKNYQDRKSQRKRKLET